MSNIALKNLELTDASNFKQIMDVYIEALADKSTDADGYELYLYEKEVAKDSLCNLAEMLDRQWHTGRARRLPISVWDWGKRNREKHGVEEND